MKKSMLTLLAVLMSAAAAPADGIRAQEDSLLSLLPSSEAIPGWSGIDVGRIYGGKALYAFIDGGADLFLEYGFRQVVAREYAGEGNASINLEIYEMEDAGAAFGIWSVRSGREAKPVHIGQGGSAHPYYIMFWKGQYYVSLAASDSSLVCRQGMESIARAVDHRLFAAGRQPTTMEGLPVEGLVHKRYFRGYLGLSSVRLLDLKEIFPALDGAAGIYADHAMILLRYDGESEAAQRLADISGKLKSDGRFNDFAHRGGLVCATDRRNQVICAGRSGSYLFIAVSSKASVAESSCNTAMNGFRDR